MEKEKYKEPEVDPTERNQDLRHPHHPKSLAIISNTGLMSIDAALDRPENQWPTSKARIRRPSGIHQYVKPPCAPSLHPSPLRVKPDPPLKPAATQTRNHQTQKKK